MRELARLDRFPENVRVLTVVVAELELGDIDRQMLAAHLVERAHHSALNQRPETFNRVGVDRADNVLAYGVVDDAMRILALHVLVSEIVVSADQADLMGDGLANELTQGFLAHIPDNASNHISLATDSASDRSLPRADTAASTLAAAAFVLVPVPSGRNLTVESEWGFPR